MLVLHNSQHAKPQVHYNIMLSMHVRAHVPHGCHAPQVNQTGVAMYNLIPVVPYPRDLLVAQVAMRCALCIHFTASTSPLQPVIKAASMRYRKR